MIDMTLVVFSGLNEHNYNDNKLLILDLEQENWLKAKDPSTQRRLFI